MLELKFKCIDDCNVNFIELVKNLEKQLKICISETAIKTDL